MAGVVYVESGMSALDAIRPASGGLGRSCRLHGPWPSLDRRAAPGYLTLVQDSAATGGRTTSNIASGSAAALDAALWRARHAQVKVNRLALVAAARHVIDLWVL